MVDAPDRNAAAEKLNARAAHCASNAITLRHRLHEIPELHYQELKTAQLIRDELDRLGLGYSAGVTGAETATVAVLGDTSKPCIALRADIDALPVAEETGAPYASRHPGRMHACGHDGHSAILLGTTALLQELLSKLPVCVKLIWQPAEETGGGANRLVEAGVLDGRIGPAVKAIFGLHGWPTLPLGSVSTKPGPLLEATDSFAATFVGRGCHGAFPHLGVDPLVAACQSVVNLQQCVSRELDPLEPGLVSVCMVHGGTAVNIIPDSATIEGTIRTLAPGPRNMMRRAVERRCAGIATAQNCELHFSLTEGYPATINHPDLAAYVGKVAKQSAGLNGFIPADRPVMGGEDFSYYLEKVPGCFFFLGVCPQGRDQYFSLHSNRYDFPDQAIEAGIRMFGALALNFEDNNNEDLPFS